MTDSSNQLCVVGGVFAQVRPGPEGNAPCSPGGRGALCAIGASRLGADVELVGVVGDDDLGSRLRADLIAEGVSVETLLPRAGSPTKRCGVAAEGHAELGPKDVDAARSAITGAKVLLVSQDVPQDALERAIEIAHRADRTVVLRASLGEPLADKRLGQLDLWIGTPAEARAFLGLEPEDECSPGGLARRMAAQGPRSVALWLGVPDVSAPGGGAVMFDGEKVHSHPGLGPDVSDPVAFDAFTAALCIAWLEDLRPLAAMRLAVAAAALGPADARATDAAAGEGTTAVAAEPDAARLPLRDLVERRIASPASLLPTDAADPTGLPRPL